MGQPETDMGNHSKVITGLSHDSAIVPCSSVVSPD